MDPLAAISLAGTVLQFVEFAGKTIVKTEQILRSGSGVSEDGEHLDDVYSKLSNVSHSLAQKTSASAGNASFDADLVGLAETCKADCKDLLAILNSLRLQPDQKKRWWRGAQKAVLEAWKREDIERLRKRIADVQRVMTLKVCALSSVNIAEVSKTLKSLEGESAVFSASWASELTKLHYSVTRIQHDVDRIQVWSKMKTEEALGPKLEELTKKVIDASTRSQTLSRELDVLRSLDYDHRSARQEAIPEAHQKTFQWIFDVKAKPKTDGGGSPELPDPAAEANRIASGSPAPASAAEAESIPASNMAAPQPPVVNPTDEENVDDAADGENSVQDRFLRWLSTGDSIFWVTGKPGSGKSTLMKYITGHRRTKQTLLTWAAPKVPITASHYFWSPGTAMQKSQEGLLRSILYDILTEVAYLLPKLCPDRWADAGRLRQRDWSVAELTAVLHKLSRLQDVRCRFCLFVDGLDEYDGDHQDLCDTFSDLARSPYFKVCVSSRPWNVFADNFGSDAQNVLPIHELTRSDITTFVNDRLRQHPRWAGLEIRNESASSLINEITNRADGVFLWVFLVIRELRSGLTNDDSLADLTRRLESLPTDLEQFFRHIIMSVDPVYHQKMAGTLRIALACESPLSDFIYVLHEKEYESEDYALKAPIEVADIGSSSSTRINALCKGLLEIRSVAASKQKYVEFLHRTVRDFLMTGEMMEFLNLKSRRGFRPSISVLRAHLAWIKQARFPGTILQIRPGCYSPSPAATALSSALTYASLAEEEDEAATHAMLDNLEWALPVMAFQGQLHFQRAESEFALLQRVEAFFRQHLLTRDLPGFVSRKLALSLHYFVAIPDPLYRLLLTTESQLGRLSPKWTAWSPRRVKMIRLMLQNGFSPNESFTPPDGIACTPWTALLSGFAAEPSANEEGFEEQEAGFVAALNLGIFSLLLEHGAKPNAAVGEGLPAWMVFYLFSLRFPHLFEHRAAYLRELGAFIKQGAKPAPAATLEAIRPGRFYFRPRDEDGTAWVDDSTPHWKAVDNLGEPKAVVHHFCDDVLHTVTQVYPDIKAWLGEVRNPRKALPP